MKKATATYVAPDGDAEIVYMGGVRFVDGQAVDLNSDDHAHLMSKLPGNPHFDVEISDQEVPSEPKRKRGRPSNEEKAATEQKAADDKAAADKAAADKVAADKAASGA